MSRMMDKQDDRIYKYWWFIYLLVNTWQPQNGNANTAKHQSNPENRLCMLTPSRLVRSWLTYNNAHYLTMELWHLSLSFKPWLWIYRQSHSTTDNELPISDCANQLSVAVTEHLRRSAYNARKGSQIWGFSSMVFWACRGTVHPGRSGWQKLLWHRQQKRRGQSLNIPLRTHPW